jgi:DNA-binding NtrC family response regulator
MHSLVQRSGEPEVLLKTYSHDRLKRVRRSSATCDAPSNERQPCIEKMASYSNFDAMIGADPPFLTAMAMAARAVRRRSHLLIEGESGTGKHMLVRSIQTACSHAKAPLRILNVGGIPALSVESLLFGHEKGAFPGAFDRHIGALEHTEGGTLVLNEIERLDENVQRSLAEALHWGEARPVGSRHSFKIDVRLIVVSNVPLIERINSGHFLSALHKVISRSHVTLPPLRARANDIPALAYRFLAHTIVDLEKRALSITESALALLKAHDWPGNVRQFHAVLFHAAIGRDGGTLTPDDFAHLSNAVSDNHPFGNVKRGEVGIPLFVADGHIRPLGDIEADVIRFAVNHYGGSMTNVARRLGIGRSTLYRKLIELGIGGVT